MRSYYAHLQSMVPSVAIPTKPILRTSAIFPVFQEMGISTRILYMGYWFVKRNITALTQVITLRKQDGEILWRSVSNLTETKAYRVELSDLLKQAGFDPQIAFEGSIELEFFSLQNLVFPFPALVVNYYGEGFTTVVHTAQRVYSNFEDKEANSETKVPEAGFNVYANDKTSPFITLINGPEKCPGSQLHVECFNRRGDVLKESILLGDLAPYSMHHIDLASKLPLKEFLNNQVGTMRIIFDVRWVFPRLLVGNWQENPTSIVVTHTYYDCTRACSPSDYWYTNENDWHTAALMLPLCAQGSAQTKFYFYPIYSPSSFSIDLEIYDGEGKCIGTVPDALHIRSPSNEFEIIDAAAHVKELGLEGSFPLGARLIARPDPGTNLPSRVKLGVDIGSSPQDLPCNICTNLNPYIPTWEGKKQSFKWAPILSDNENAEVWIMNSSPQIKYERTAKIDLHFYRESDTNVLERTYTILPHGSIVISPKNDPELKEFLQGKIGWVTVLSTNPYTTTYYFSRPQKGVVGGDHGF